MYDIYLKYNTLYSSARRCCMKNTHARTLWESFYDAFYDAVPKHLGKHLMHTCDHSGNIWATFMNKKGTLLQQNKWTNRITGGIQYENKMGNLH